MIMKLFKFTPPWRGKQKNNGLARRSMAEGFTLVETLVAVSIFSLSILGLLVILSQGIAETNYAKKKMIAGYLAQEGIEYVRNMRDTYMLYYDTASSASGWNHFKTALSGASCDINNGCYFDDSALDFSAHSAQMTTITTLYACNTSTCPDLYYNSFNGSYNNIGSGVDSGYARQIRVAPVAGTTHEIKVSSTVYWNQASGGYSVTFSEDLFDWIQ